MKRKKILTITLALVLALALMVPAFASEATDIPPAIEQETTAPVQQPEEGAPPDTPAPEEIPDPVDPAPVPDEVTEPVNPVPAPDETTDPVDPQTPSGEEAPAGEEPPEEEQEERVIDVLVPASGRMVVNPYCMPVATTYGETPDQIVHEPQALVNNSDFPVMVSAQVVGTLCPESTARFVSMPPAEDAVDKEIFLYMEFQNDPALWFEVYTDAPNQILVTDWGMGKENVLVLDAFGAGYFRLFGAMTGFPEIMWGEEDAPDVTVSFTFAEIPEATALSPENPAETSEIDPEAAETAPEVNPEEGVAVEADPDAIPEPVPDSVSEPVPNPAPEPTPEPVPGEIPVPEPTPDPALEESTELDMDSEADPLPTLDQVPETTPAPAPET